MVVQHAHSTDYACGFTNGLAGKEVYWMQGHVSIMPSEALPMVRETRLRF